MSTRSSILVTVFLVTTALLLPSTVFAGDPLYSLASSDGNLRLISFIDGSTMSTTAMTIAGATVDSGSGLAYHPLENQFYAVLQLSPGGVTLVTLDVGTGVATSVGSLSESIAGIEFDASGVLWGVSGNSSTNPNTLFQINTGTAALSTLTAMSGSGKQTISRAFGNLYHWADSGGSLVFETVLPMAPWTAAAISPTGDTFDHARGAVALNINLLLFAGEDTSNDDRLFSVTVPGHVVTDLGAMDHRASALAIQSWLPAELMTLSIE